MKKMDISVITSKTSEKYADILVLKINSIHAKSIIISMFSIEEAEFYKFGSTNFADIIILIIDSTFCEEVNKNYYISTFLKNLKTSNATLIPIIVENAKIPNEIMGVKHIYCSNNLDLLRAKRYIKKQINLITASKKNDTNLSKILNLSRAIVINFIIFSLGLIIADKYINDSIFNNSILIFINIIILLASSIIQFIYSILSNIKSDEIVLENYSQKLEEAVVSEKIKDDSCQVSSVKYSNPSSEIEDYKTNQFNSCENNNSNTANSETKAIDAIKHMNLNLENIKEFYTWSQRQAKAAFILAVSLCILGFGLIFCSILFPLIYNLNFQMSIVPGIGGAVVEVIAGTALVIYQRSLLQLNHYHRALHEDERFLSSINLLNKFSTTELQDEMLKEIIKSEIKMNILETEKEIVKSDKNTKQ